MRGSVTRSAHPQHGLFGVEMEGRMQAERRLKQATFSQLTSENMFLMNMQNISQVFLFFHSGPLPLTISCKQCQFKACSFSSKPLDIAVLLSRLGPGQRSGF